MRTRVRAFLTVSQNNPKSHFSMTTLKTNPKSSETTHILQSSKRTAKAPVAEATVCPPKLNLHRNLGIALLTMGALMASRSPGYAATETWVGGASDGNWTSSLNWSGTNAGGVPVAGDTLIFGATSGTTTLNYNQSFTNNDPRWASITFAAGAPAYTITGTTMTIASGLITNNSANTHQHIRRR